MENEQIRLTLEDFKAKKSELTEILNNVTGGMSVVIGPGIECKCTCEVICCG